MTADDAKGHIQSRRYDEHLREPHHLYHEAPCNRIRKVLPSGETSTLAGSGDYGDADGAGATAQFSYPCGVAVDMDGNVYVADMNSHRIWKIEVAAASPLVKAAGRRSAPDDAAAAAAARVRGGSSSGGKQ